MTEMSILLLIYNLGNSMTTCGVHFLVDDAKKAGIQYDSNHKKRQPTGGGGFGLMALKRSSSSSSANRLCAAGFTELSLGL